MGRDESVLETCVLVTSGSPVRLVLNFRDTVYGRKMPFAHFHLSWFEPLGRCKATSRISKACESHICSVTCSFTPPSPEGNTELQSTQLRGLFLLGDTAGLCMALCIRDTVSSISFFSFFFLKESLKNNWGNIVFRFTKKVADTWVDLHEDCKEERTARLALSIDNKTCLPTPHSSFINFQKYKKIIHCCVRLFLAATSQR